VRAVFGFPLRVGAVRLGALDLYQERPGPLSNDQHTDAVVMADVVARWVLDMQADATQGSLAGEIEAGAEFYLSVHNAAGPYRLSSESLSPRPRSGCAPTPSLTTGRFETSPKTSSPESYDSMKDG
jgi:hypothetical protein